MEGSNLGLSGVGWSGPHTTRLVASPALQIYLSLWRFRLNMAFSGLSNKAEGVIEAVIGFIVVLAILGGTVALIFTNMSTLVDAFEAFTSNSTVLQALVPIFGLVLGVLIVLGIVKLVKRFTSV